MAPETPINVSDPYYLSGSDHPGLSLTNSKFEGSNFIGWSRSVKMALGAKEKIGFIDGTCSKPIISSPDHQKWIRCDYMVTCWVLNSMNTELSDAFLYAQSAVELWSEIQERFGHTNGPQIYHIQRQLNETYQGNLSVAAYYVKLKRCWDELQTLDAVPVCSCGKMDLCSCSILSKLHDSDNRNKLMQFLLKLNDEYDSARSQILSMDPLPNVNKAYYIVQQIESQKNVTRHSLDSAAFMINNPKPRTGALGNQNQKKENRQGKGYEKKFCTYCNSDGHFSDQCFERIGYPDWYKGKKVPKSMAHVNYTGSFEPIGDNPLESITDTSSKQVNNNVDQNLVTAVCQEMFRMFKGQLPAESHSDSSVNFAGPFH